MEEDPRYGAILPPLSVHLAPEFLPLSYFNGSVVSDLRTYKDIFQLRDLFLHQ